ncbi:MAG: SGNH/GDSL hydrolase family protein [Planctomycetales bacterium]|nr:SGNH/GDSL hydrolase family protein [Planctomycetales bacterium]
MESPTTTDSEHSGDRFRLSRWHWWVAVFCVATTAGAIFLKYRWLGFYDIADESRYQTAAVEQLDESTRIVALGSSHFHASIDPRVASQEIVTLSHMCLNYELMEAILRKQIDRLTGLQCMLVELDLFPIYCDTLNQVSPEFLTLHRFGLSPQDYAPNWRKELRLAIYESGPLTGPSLAPKAVLKRLTFDEPIVPGFHTTDLVMSQSGRERAEFHMSIFATHVVKGNKAAFVRVMDLLQSKGIKVVLVSTPRQLDYWDGINKDYVHDYHQFQADMLQRYQCPYWDFSDPATLALTEQYFQDGDHLNRSGASQFTKAINARLAEFLAIESASH